MEGLPRVGEGGVATQVLPGSNTCPVCATVTPAPVRLPYVEREFSHVPSEHNPFAGLEILTCNNCGFGWASPSVAQTMLADFYRTIYTGPSSAYRVNNPMGKTVAPLDPRATAQLLLAKMHRRFKSGEAFLDIGPGYGESFLMLSRLIPGLQGFAFEPNEAPRDFLERVLGVRVFPYAFPADGGSMIFPAETVVHLVLMSHVLEHFNGKDVITVLRNVRNLLAGDGILVCEVPHCDWRQHEHLRTSDSPHLSFFSAESLREALGQAGYAVKFLETCGMTYDAWWAQANAAGPATSRPHVRKERPAWLKQALRAFWPHLPVWMRGWLEAPLWPARVADFLRSEDLNYGGNRTCLRAVASHA